MENYLIRNISAVNEGSVRATDVLIRKGRIEKIAPAIGVPYAVRELNGEGLFLLPGVIDDQVHFREPGLTHKADIRSEAMAAVAGGTTSFMDMPNTLPPVFTRDLLEEKYRIAAAYSVANYSFYMGTSNGNTEEVLRVNEQAREICGIKIFMGSSTGGLLVDRPEILDLIFRGSGLPVVTHCEDEQRIRENRERLKREKGTLQPSDHPLIRDEAACFQSTRMAVDLARRHGTRLHVLHISTAEELALFEAGPIAQKRITAEVCVHHLHFTAADYPSLGNRIKCNPAIKEGRHRDALWQALLEDRLDIIATDHAPHTEQEKSGSYEEAHAGLPLVQHALPLMLHYVSEGQLPLERLVEKMSHAPALCFGVRERGFIREGYHADLVIVDLRQAFTVSRENIRYKCGWSPLEGFRLPATVRATFVNGRLAYSNMQGEDRVVEEPLGERLQFDR